MWPLLEEGIYWVQNIFAANRHNVNMSYIQLLFRNSVLLRNCSTDWSYAILHRALPEYSGTMCYNAT